MLISAPLTLALVSYPPLSTISQAPLELSGNVTFRAAVDVVKSQGLEFGKEWITELLYGRDGEKFENWRTLPFLYNNGSDATGCIHSLSEDSTEVERLHYSLNFDPQTTDSLSFTIRTRPSKSSKWIFTDEKPGRITFPHKELRRRAPKNVAEIFPEAAGLQTEKKDINYDGKQPGITVFTVTAPAKPGRNSVTLGAPASKVHKFYALSKSPNGGSWYEPEAGEGEQIKLNDKKYATMVGFNYQENSHVVVLGQISKEGTTTTYITEKDGKLVMTTENGSGQDQLHKVIVAEGFQYRDVVDAAFRALRDDLGAGRESSVGQQVSIGGEFKPQWFDGLGYCTWNGLGRELTQDRVLDALQKLHDAGIRIQTVIIDDNWQSLIDRKWDRFEADSKTFPGGLKALVSEVRKRFPYIRDILVWHAMLGYWDGIHDNGQIAKDYKTEVIKTNGGNDLRIVQAGEAARLYDNFYKFLAESGVTGVKTDVQSAMDGIDDLGKRSEVTKAYLAAFKASSQKYFDRKAIYCMAMQPQVLQSLLPAGDNPTIFRNSDDFFPDIPNSHVKHINNNAVNALYTTHLNGLPDWDMFQTTLHTYGDLHAVARAMSGGPIYVTDSPGQHNLEMFKKMTATAPNLADQVVLRMAKAVTADPYVPIEGKKFVRIGSYTLPSQGNKRSLTLINSGSSTSTEGINILEFFRFLPASYWDPPTGIKHGFYVFTSFNGRKVSDSFSNLGVDHTFSLTLGTNGVEIVTLHPAYAIPKSEAKAAVLGLGEQYAGPAAIQAQTVSNSDGLVFELNLKAVGRLEIFLSDVKARKDNNWKGLKVTIEGVEVPKQHFAAIKDDKVLEIDMRSAVGPKKHEKPSIKVVVTIDSKALTETFTKANPRPKENEVKKDEKDVKVEGSDIDSDDEDDDATTSNGNGNGNGGTRGGSTTTNGGTRPTQPQLEPEQGPKFPKLNLNSEPGGSVFSEGPNNVESNIGNKEKGGDGGRASEFVPLSGGVRVRGEVWMGLVVFVAALVI